MKGKKGAFPLMMIFELLAVVSLFFVGFKITNILLDEQSVDAVFFAEDMKLMVETLVGVPGDVVVEFPYDTSSYIVAFPGSGPLRDTDPIQSVVIVTLLDEEENVQTKVERTFHVPPNFIITSTAGNVESSCLDKRANRIVLRECSDKDFLQSDDGALVAGVTSVGVKTT